MDPLYEELMKVQLATDDVRFQKYMLDQKYHLPGQEKKIAQKAVEAAESRYTLAIFNFCHYALASR